MNRVTLVVNSGSSSVKFALFKHVKDASLVAVFCRGTIEWIGTEPRFNIDRLSIEEGASDVIPTATAMEGVETVEQAHEILVRWINSFISPSHITLVCYRVVHGGDLHMSVELNQQVLQYLESLIPFAPLHQTLALNSIDVFMKAYPDAQHKACFDTAFHRTMPEVARTFAIPSEYTDQGIKPYGFHGLSYQYIASRLPEISKGNLPRRVIVAHLGSGASLCALKDGVSIATTMTFTPLDGLPMATRCGAIDAGAVLYMAAELKMSVEDISNMLNKKSGLMGLSGISGDIRILLQDTSEKATFALEYFIYRICRELGAFIGVLQGLDALVFTGGTGAHSWQVRQKVCEQFSWLGISVDSKANILNEILISDSESKIQVFAVKTDEEIIMEKLANFAN